MARSDKTRQLSIEQQNAVDLLVCGKSDAETAAAVGVSRQTVNAWRNHDAEFIAALNRQREALWSASQDALRAAADSAVQVLVNGLQSADPRLAMSAAVHILKSAGVYGAPPALGHTEAADIEAEWVAKELTRSLWPPR